MAAVDRDSVIADVLRLANLNAPGNYDQTVTDPRAASQEIRDFVIAADGAVVEAIVSNPNNGQRAGFRTTANVTHGGALPARIGPIDSVTINSKAAELWSKSEIENERTNRLSLTSINPHFAVDGNTLFINMGTATVAYFTYTAGTACQAPSEYYGAVLSGALMYAMNHEGEDPASAGLYATQFNTMLAAIRAGQAVPPFQAMG